MNPPKDEQSRTPARRRQMTSPAIAGIHTSEKLVGRLAQRYGVPANTLLSALRDTIFKPPKGEAAFSDVELAAALVLAEKYSLNPFAKEIYVTRSRGVLLVIVPIDGWSKIANRQEDYDGCEFEYRDREDGEPYSCTCRIFRRSRTRATEITEFYDECFRDTEPWKKWPRRMLRHKSFIQAVRLAYSLSEAVDDDEAARMGVRTPEYHVVEKKPEPAIAEPAPRQRPKEVAAPEPEEPAANTDSTTAASIQTSPSEDSEETKTRKGKLLEEWHAMRQQLSREEQDEVRTFAQVGLVNTRATLAQLEAVCAKAEEIVAARE